MLGGAKAGGQVVDITFGARSAGRQEYALYVMSDCWLAADAMVPIRVKVQELSRAEKEGRAHRGKRVIPLDEAGNPEGAHILPSPALLALPLCRCHA